MLRLVLMLLLQQLIEVVVQWSLLLLLLLPLPLPVTLLLILPLPVSHCC